MSFILILLAFASVPVTILGLYRVFYYLNDYRLVKQNWQLMAANFGFQTNIKASSLWTLLKGFRLTAHGSYAGFDCKICWENIRRHSNGELRCTFVCTNPAELVFKLDKSFRHFGNKSVNIGTAWFDDNFNFKLNQPNYASRILNQDALDSLRNVFAIQTHCVLELNPIEEGGTILGTVLDTKTKASLSYFNNNLTVLKKHQHQHVIELVQTLVIMAQNIEAA